jgi:hypothetical protein
VKRFARRPARIVATGAVAVGAALTLSGCVLASPATTYDPYPAGDGSAGSITDPATKSMIKLQNFFVVASAKGQPGTLVGAVVNTGTSNVTVQLSVADQGGGSSIGQTSVSANAGAIAKVGPADTALTLASVPQAPGAVLDLVAKTNGGGSIHFTVPVLPPSGAYASLTPAPTS